MMSLAAVVLSSESASVDVARSNSRGAENTIRSFILPASLDGRLGRGTVDGDNGENAQYALQSSAWTPPYPLPVESPPPPSSAAAPLPGESLASPSPPSVAKTPSRFEGEATVRASPPPPSAS